jgi:hypothetical protein
MRNYKVLVTKDFPRIYEQRVHFDGDDPKSETAVIRDEYYVNEAYNEHTVPAEVLKKPDWHWSMEEVKKDFVRRCNEKLVQKIKQIERLQAEVKNLRETEFSEYDVEPGKWCENMPTGMQEQIERHCRIEHRREKKRLEEELEFQHKKMKKLEARMKEMG